jgi:hypothetical protein
LNERVALIPPWKQGDDDLLIDRTGEAPQPFRRIRTTWRA